MQSERSLRYAAQHGVNAYTVPGPATFMKQNIEIYHAEAEKAGWPDRLRPRMVRLARPLRWPAKA